MEYSNAQLKGYGEAVQSLKLYRRAELRDVADDEPIIEELYVDPLQNDAVLETMLRPNTTFLIGRKGTGKSTVFQRAQHEIRKKNRTISAYIDIKTVFESAVVDNDVSQKISAISGAVTESDLKRILLYRSFTRSVFVDIQKELKSQINNSFLEKIFGKSDHNNKRLTAIESIDQLLEGAFEADITDVTGISSTLVKKNSNNKSTSSSKASAGVKVSAGATGVPSADMQFDTGLEDSTELAFGDSKEFSQILIKTFNINRIMERLEAVLSGIGIRHLYIFLDDFSELPIDAMSILVDSILAPLNNWSNELIKFKVAAYPGRIYLGKIDATKIDEIYLDTYRLYGSSDVSSMETKAVDFTFRLLDSRFSYFLDTGFDVFCDTDPHEVYRQLFFASMGNPRILGHLLHNLGETHVGYGRRIGPRAIQDAAARYYEEKVEPFFGIQKFAHESFAERSSIFSLKELLESIVSQARKLRDYKGSAVTKEISGRTPSSHFHIVSEFESILSTLELNFFISKYYEMKDRDGRKVSVFALNYGLCYRYSIAFGRPTALREHRLYFVERIFDYSPILRKYLQKNQEIKCDACGEVQSLDKLESLKLFDMLCPACKKGTCSVSNLSRKYEAIIKDINSELLLPNTELGILETLYPEASGLAAADIAGELDCSYQLVGKRGKIMAERGLVEREKNAKNRRIFFITQKAKEEYFDQNSDRKLSVPD